VAVGLIVAVVAVVRVVSTTACLIGEETPGPSPLADEQDFRLDDRFSCVCCCCCVVVVVIVVVAVGVGGYEPKLHSRWCMWRLSCSRTNRVQ
jgi:hypothetical protein